MHDPKQNIALGNWLLDQFGVERQQASWGGRVAAFAVGAGALAFAAWGLKELVGARANRLL